MNSDIDSQQNTDVEVELVGIREFAGLVHVSHQAISKAVVSGRLTACVKVRGVRKLKKLEALKEWRQVHAVEQVRQADRTQDKDTVDVNAGSGRRVEPSEQKAFWHRFIPSGDSGLDENIGLTDRSAEFCLRNACFWLLHALECGCSIPGYLDALNVGLDVVNGLHSGIVDAYYGPEELEPFPVCDGEL